MYDPKSTFLVIRDGEIKLRLVGAQVIRGKVRAKTTGGLGFVVPREKAERDGVLAEIAALMRAGKMAEVEERFADYLAGPGEYEGNLLVITERDWTERQRQERGRRLWGREIGFASDGRVVLTHDERDSLGELVEESGCRWRVTGVGRSFERGDAHRVRYAYLEFVEVIDADDAYGSMRQLKREELDRYDQQFERMMGDGANDGANPPRPISKIPDNIIALIDTSTRERGDARASVEAYCHSTHYAKAGAGRRAKERLDAGEDAQTVAADMDREWSQWCTEHVD